MESMYSVAGYISVPDADLEISKGGRGVGGRAVIQTLLVSVWSKNKGGGPAPPRAPPLDPPLYFKGTAFMYSSMYSMKISPHMNCLNLGFFPIILLFLLWLASILM